jgi:hypothetical protein
MYALDESTRSITVFGSATVVSATQQSTSTHPQRSLTMRVLNVVLNTVYAKYRVQAQHRGHSCAQFVK